MDSTDRLCSILSACVALVIGVMIFAGTTCERIDHDSFDKCVHETQKPLECGRAHS